MSNYLQENIYYNSTRLNTTSEQIAAEQDDRLLNPIISNAMNFNLAINQAKIPIGSIPLTQTNIDLHAYEVTLQDTVNGELVSASAFAPQVNAKTGSFLYNYATTGVITKYSYNQTTGALTPIGSGINVNSSITGVTQMVVDQFENYYLINADTLVVINQSNDVLTSLNFESTQLQSIAIDPVETIYLAVESSIDGSSVNVYQNDNSATTCTLSLVQSITQGPSGTPLSAINTVCADDNIIVGYEANKFAIYDVTNYALVSSFEDANIVQLGQSSQTLAGSDSFCVVDNGAINDIFLGFPTGGSSTQLQNLIGAAPWLTTATPFAGSSAYLSGTGTGYIIGTDNNTYKYTPYNVAGSVPSLVTSSSPISTGGVVQAGNQPGFVGKEALTTNLLGFDTNNINSTVYKQLADDFLITTGTTSISVFDIQNTTNDIFAVGTDENLYQSTLPFFPKQLLIGSIASPSITNTGLSQIGFSWNEADTTNSVSGIVNKTQIPKGSNADVIDYGCAIPGDGYAYILRADSVTGQVIVGQLQFPDLTITAGATIPNISTSATSYAFGATIISGETWFVMSDNTQTIYLEKNDYTGQVTFQLEDAPQVGGQGNIQLATYIQGGQNYVAITNGDKIYVYDITNPSVVVNVLNYALVGGVPVASAIAWANGSIYAMIGPVSVLKQLTYTIGGGGAFTIDSITTIGNDLPINLAINCLSSNEIQQEVYILQTSTNTPVAVVSTSTLAVTSNFSMPTTVNASASRYIASLPNLNTFYGNGMWTQVTTGTNLITSVVISKNNPNNFYVTYNSNNLVYKGVYVPSAFGLSSITNLTRYLPITGTWTQISAAIPEINGSYQSKVYAFTISTQTALANSPINYGSTKIPAISCNRYERVTAPAITQTYGISKFGIGVDYVNAEDLAFLVSSTLPTANAVFTLSGGDIDAGPANIYDMIVVVNAVNAALLEAWGKLTGAYGSNYSGSPSLSLDYNTGYLTLSYPAGYVTQKPSSIIFNTALLTIAYFYNIPTSDGNGGYIVLPTGSTSITQTSKTIYIFNQLDQLLFETQSLFVQGTYFSLVSTSRIITDIGVDTSAIINNIGEKVIYNPFILRSFKMNSNLPVSRVHMRILYQYKDGTTYPLLLNPGENFFVKINFVSKV